MIACSYNGWSRDNAWLTSPNPEKCDNTRLQPHWRRECDHDNHDSSWILQLIAQIAFVRDFSWAASAFGQVSSPLVTLAVEPKHSAARKKPLAPRVRLCLLKNWKWTWQITRPFRDHVTNLVKYDQMLSAFRKKYWHENNRPCHGFRRHLDQ